MEKKLAKYCPLCVQKDSTSVVTQVRDTTIIIPGETIYIQDTLYCDSLGHVISKLGERLRDKDGKIITLETRLKNNVYYTRAKTQVIYKTIKGHTIYKDSVKVIVSPPVKYIPKWAHFMITMGGIFITLILLWITWQIAKRTVMPI